MGLLLRWDIRGKCIPVTCTRFPHILATRTSAKRTPTTRTKLLLKLIRQDSQCHKPVTKVVLVTPDTVVMDLRQKERYKAHRNRPTIKRKVTVSKFELTLCATFELCRDIIFIEIEPINQVQHQVQQNKRL